MALRDTLRSCGIPIEWVDVQASAVASRSGSHRLHVRLLLKHWDERLLKYLPLFESRLIAEIERYDHDVGNWLRSLSWQFAMDAYPHAVMPAPQVWRAPDPHAPGSDAALSGAGMEVRELTSPARSQAGQPPAAARPSVPGVDWASAGMPPPARTGTGGSAASRSGPATRPSPGSGPAAGADAQKDTLARPRDFQPTRPMVLKDFVNTRPGR